MTMATEKIFIQIDDERIELTGSDKEAFIAQREEDNVQFSLREAEQSAKRDARDSAIKKLGEIAGLTKEELDAIL
jgi:ABC-type transporter Mla maintaining outer membrane lipid asymmetry ATPase subunit MlaF